MGRPIKKRFFGSTISPYRNLATGGKTGVGAEGIGSLGLTAGSGYSKGVTITVGAPNIAGGVQAVITPTVGNYSSSRTITTATITNAGSGYTSMPSLTITKPTTITNLPVNFVPYTGYGGISWSTGTTAVTTSSLQTGIYEGMNITTSAAGIPASTKVVSVTGPVAGLYTINISNTASGLITVLTFTDGGSTAAIAGQLSTGRQDTIVFASTLTGGTVRTNGDILKQEGSHRYLIQNTDGKGICKLVAKANADLLPNEMNIIATDANGNTYYVTKLTARKARLIQLTQNGANAWLVANGGQTGWNVGSATGTIVSIANTI